MMILYFVRGLYLKTMAHRLFSILGIFSFLHIFISGYGQEHQSLTENYSIDSLAIWKLIRTAADISSKDPDSALHIYKEAYAAGKASSNVRMMGVCIQGMAELYIRYNKFGEALGLFTEALILCAYMPAYVQTMLPFIYNGLATVYKIKGDLERASQYYYVSAALAEKFSDVGGGAIYNNIGTIQMSMGDQERALYYLDLAERTADSAKNESVRIHALVNKGVVYTTQEKWEQSEFYLKTALAEAEENRAHMVVPLALIQLGKLFLKQRDPDKALAYLSRINRDNAIGHEYQFYADYYSAQAYLLQGKKSIADDFFGSALTTAREFGNIPILMEIHKTLAGLYEERKDYKNSLQHHNDYSALRDSIKEIRLGGTISELEIKYRTAEKDKELLAKKLALRQKDDDIRKKNLLIAGILTGVAALTFFVIWLFRYHRQQNKIHQRQIFMLSQEKKLAAREQEIIRLKALMEGEEKERIRIAQNLHDGVVVQFSAAKMNISALINKYTALEHEHGYTASLQQLDEAIRELRNTAHNLLPDILQEEGLGEALFYFCNNIGGSNGHLRIDFLSYGEIPRLSSEFELHIYRIIQELVYNIVKHASASLALVQISYLKGLLSITVKDNGTGFDEGNVLTKKGVGLKNVRTRAELLKGHLEINSEPEQGTVIYLEIDVNNQIKNHNNYAYKNSDCG